MSMAALELIADEQAELINGGFLNFDFSNATFIGINRGNVAGGSATVDDQVQVAVVLPRPTLGFGRYRSRRGR
jgi:hypothetical protein